MASPRLTVIIASYNSRDTIGACLSSLERQVDPNSFEIIVVDSSRDGTDEYVRQKFPLVKMIHLPERKFCGDARNIGIARARGEIVAFIDADCLAEPRWTLEILQAHKSEYPAIGGAIANGNPRSWIGWAAYFTEFSKWMPGTRPKLLSDIAGANMSYKKKIFAEFGSFIEGTYCSDTEFHWRLCNGGHRLLFDPSIAVRHCSIEKLGGFLKHEVFHGRCFARVRVQARDFSSLKRIVYSLAMPLVFIKILLDIVRENLGNRYYLKQFILALPLVVSGVFSWSAGELLGYLEVRE